MRERRRQLKGNAPGKRFGMEKKMNLAILLIAAWVPLLPLLTILLRSGSFGRGSVGTLFKLFFLGVAAAVPAFLMEAGALFSLQVLLGVLPGTVFAGKTLLVFSILRYLLVVALIEESWKHFVLRATTWKQMTMDSAADGIAAAGIVSAGFAAVLYGFWQLAFLLVSSDMEAVRASMPDYLRAGSVTAFLFALLFVFGHFGYSGFMGALYGIAKGSEQKAHGRRAGFMLFVSWLLSVLTHGVCAVLIGYGIAAESLLWLVLGFMGQTVLSLIMTSALSSASDARRVDSGGTEENLPVDFADSEEFAEFAESGGEYSPAEYSQTEHSPAEYSPAEYSQTEYSQTEYRPAEAGPAEPEETYAGPEPSAGEGWQDAQPAAYDASSASLPEDNPGGADQDTDLS